MNTTNLVAPDKETYDRPLHSGDATPPECANAFLPGDDSTYGTIGDGQSGLVVQALHEPVKPRAHNILQVISAYNDNAAAEKFLNQRLNDWASCTGRTVTLRYDDGTKDQAHLGPAGKSDDITYLQVTNTDPTSANGMVCQRAITGASNVVIDVRACAKDIGTEALDIARQIKQNVH